jgi:glycosyltransferase involved in cell wall biosynthesis
MRRLLMIAYHFPPSLLVGRIRTVKFSKYLPQFSWQPVVLTCQPPPGTPCDPHHEIPPGTEVHRIGQDNFHPWLTAGAATARTIIGRAMGFLRPTRSDRSGRQSPGTLGLGRGSTLSTWLRTLTFWPDSQCTWIPAAARKALALARSCDAIYSSGNPWSDHTIAWRVREFTSLPWIMDYRDPWMISGLEQYPFSLQRRLIEHLEHRCVATSDRVLQTTDPRTRMYQEAYPDQSKDKFITLANGFDPDDFEDLPSPKPEFPMTMTYLGTLGPDRSTAALIPALTLLRQRNQIKSGELRVRLIGRNTPEYPKAIEQTGLSDMFDLVPPMPRHIALAALARSHVALLLGGPRFEKIAIPTKFYEYLAMKKPILALIPKGHMSAKLETAGVGYVDFLDAEQIADAILGILKEFRRRKCLDPPKPLPEMAQYSRKHLTGRLASLLNEIALVDGKCQHGR